MQVSASVSHNNTNSWPTRGKFALCTLCIVNIVINGGGVHEVNQHCETFKHQYPLEDTNARIEGNEENHGNLAGGSVQGKQPLEVGRYIHVHVCLCMQPQMKPTNINVVHCRRHGQKKGVKLEQKVCVLLIKLEMKTRKDTKWRKQQKQNLAKTAIGQETIRL